MTQTQRKRIIMLIDSLGMGGAERLLAIYMRHFDTARFEARVCALQVRDNNPISNDIQQSGIPVDLVSVPHLRNLSGVPRLLSYLRRQQADLLHTQLEFADTLGGIAAKIAGIPVVTTLHTFDDPPDHTRTFWRLKLRWWLLRHLFNRVIAVSEGTRQHHIRMGNLLPDKVVTIYNGIDLSRFITSYNQSKRLVNRQALGIPPHAPLLITVAVLRQPKGLQYLIEALPAILEAVPETYYLVVGDGEHGDALKALAKTHQVAERVIFTGVRNDIPDLLALSDVFVLPTLGEALPTVLAEAMAAQKPIVVSKVGGVPEMVEHGLNGLLVPPAKPARLAEACIQILQNPDQARAIARAGWKIVEKRFNVHKQAHCVGDLYQQLLTEQGNKGEV